MAGTKRGGVTVLGRDRDDEQLTADAISVEERVAERQVELTSEDLRRRLQDEAEAIGIDADAFAAVLRSDERLAMEMIAKAAQNRRGKAARRQQHPPEIPSMRADHLYAEMKGMDPEQIALAARSKLPENFREHWTVMFPAPRDDGYVLNWWPVPKERVGEYGEYGFTLIPGGPLLSEAFAQSDIRCDVVANGKRCTKAFLSQEDRRDHQEAKHPREMAAAEREDRRLGRQRDEEKWAIERAERQQQLDLQREQIAVLREQMERAAPPVTTGASAPAKE